MKVLEINDAPLNSGVGTVAKILYEAVRDSYSLQLLNLKFKEGNYEKGVTINMMKFGDSININRLFAATLGKVDLDKYDYDIVHTADAMVPLFLNKRPDFVTVLHLNPLQGNDFYNLRTRYATKIAVKRAAKWSTLLVLSNFTKDLIRRYISLDAPVHVVYPYSNFNITQTTKLKLDARNSLGILEDAKVIIAVGTSMVYKNFKILYNAIRGKDFYVLRIGGNKQVEMENLGWDVPEQVHFLGAGDIPDSKVLQAYLASDVLVFTSLDEGFGLPLVEAMSIGLPVIGNRCTTVPEIVGDAGILIKDPYSGSEISSALQLVFSNLETYAEKSRERRKMFDKKIFVQRMKEIYEFKT